MTWVRDITPEDISWEILLYARAILNSECRSTRELKLSGAKVEEADALHPQFFRHSPRKVLVSISPKCLNSNSLRPTRMTKAALPYTEVSGDSGYRVMETIMGPAVYQVFAFSKVGTDKWHLIHIYIHMNNQRKCYSRC